MEKNRTCNGGERKVTLSGEGPDKPSEDKKHGYDNKSDDVNKGPESGNVKDKPDGKKTTSLENSDEEINRDAIADAFKRQHEKLKNWIAFSYTNGNPTAFAGWRDGIPFIKQLRYKGEGKFDINEKKITLKEFGGESIKDQIKKVRDPEASDVILFDGKAYRVPEFVNKMVYPANVNVFTEALNALSVSNEVYREPNFFEEDGYLRFPDSFYAKVDDSYQLILKSALNVGKVEIEVYEEGIALLRKFPKQLTLYYSVYGANVVNILRINDFPITIDAKGHPDTGKSFAIVYALKMGYGITEAILQDDAMNSPFRHHAISNSTNLPIYTEEAKITDMSKLKSRAKNIRGNKDKTLNPYDVITTWILSRNTDSLSMELDPLEKKAQEKRVFQYDFDSEDIVPTELKNIGRRFMQKIADKPGGLLYEKLKEKSISEITDKYYSLLETEPDGRKVIALLGAWIMNDTEFQPVVSEVKESTVIEEFLDKLVSAYRRIETMKTYQGDQDFRSTYEDKQLNNEIDINWDKLSFKVTVTAFNYIKRQLRIKLSAQKFAEANSFEYGSFSIGGQKSKIIKGNIPEDYSDNSEDTIENSEGSGVDSYETDYDQDNGESGLEGIL